MPHPNDETMKLLSLQLENFRCFGQCGPLDLNLDGLIGVVGPNGAGKSTLFGAVEWAFYGSQRGRGALPPLRDGAKSCRVTLEFALGDNHYRLWRSHNDAELRLVETDVVLATSTTATSAAVAATLGLSRDAFVSTFYARQREVQALDVRGDPGRRRAQLERLLGIERLRRASELARTQAQEQRLLVQALEGEQTDLEEVLRELHEREDEVRRKAPAVEAAREALAQAQATREQVRIKLAQLRARADVGRARQAKAALAQVAAEQTAEEAGRAEQELARANGAHLRLETLAPVVALRGELAARERELDLARQAHERANSLRKQWHAAQAATAAATDDLAAIPDETVELRELNERIEELRTEVEGVTTDLLTLLDELAEVEKKERRASEQLAVARRTKELDDALVVLPRLTEAAEEATTVLIRLQVAKTDFARRLVEEQEHLDAVQREGPDAECPRCKRAYGDEHATILERLAAEVDALSSQTERVEEELGAAERIRHETDKELSAVRTYESERASLTPDGAASELAQHLAQLRLDRDRQAERRAALEARRRQLQPQLDDLSRRIASLRKAEAERQARIQRLKEAQTEARFLDEQLASIGSDGYQPAAHVRVRRELAEAEEAVSESAALAALVEQLPILTQRRECATVQAAESATNATRLAAEAAELRVDPDAVAVEEQRDREAEAGSQAAAEALHLAEQEAIREDAAVQSARERLASAQEQARRVKAQRRELRYRDAVHAALNDYRGDASRRALPSLEQETSSLLAVLTRGRYSDVRISDSYSLELNDNGQPFPLRRFSGGEQDIANLALRLALSRTLARQRGIETGFVILDEILGSQDADRRAAIMDQLRELLSDFRQVFVVSHFDDIADDCDVHIKVNRSNETADAALHR
jgi:exonuclease SbcC